MQKYSLKLTCLAGLAFGFASLCGCASDNSKAALDALGQQAQSDNIAIASDVSPDQATVDPNAPLPVATQVPSGLEPVQVPTDVINGEYTSLWDVIRAGFNINHYYNNPRVQYFVQMYSKDPSLIENITTQSTPFLYSIMQMIQERNLPTELALLPIVESGFRPHARSYCGAIGIWQLMPGTAKEYDALDNYWFNSRMSVDESTSAALDYLKYLDNYFNGDWLLAIAAYNAGPGTVQNAIVRNQKAGLPTDFWSLKLPEATENYVPQFLALSVIVNDPSDYGIVLPTVPNKALVGAAVIPKQMSLSQAAKFAGINEQELMALNPGFTHGVTPPKSRGTYTLNLPVTRVNTFEQNCAANPGVTGLQSYYYATSAQGGYGYYTIRQGDSLGDISRYTGVSVAKLEAYNHLNSNGSIKVGQKLKYPVDRTSAYRNTVYRVKPGDTLFGIAQQYHVSVADLIQWNGLASGSTIHAGQNLIIKQKIQY